MGTYRLGVAKYGGVDPDEVPNWDVPILQYRQVHHILSHLGRPTAMNNMNTVE